MVLRYPSLIDAIGDAIDDANQKQLLQAESSSISVTVSSFVVTLSGEEAKSLRILPWSCARNHTSAGAYATGSIVYDTRAERVYIKPSK